MLGLASSALPWSAPAGVAKANNPTNAAGKSKLKSRRMILPL
jgi:hypothetical protein